MKALITAGLGAAALLATTSTALAGTANYPSTATFGIPNNTGQAGIPSQVFVPPGRTPVQSVQLTQVAPSFGGGGGQDLQLRLTSPDGTEVNALSVGCTTYPNTSAFTISDSAAISVDTPAFCTLENGAPTTASGKPSEPFSAFNGKPSGGVWTVTVVDAGISATLGSWNGWSLQVVHANPTLKADPAPFKIQKKFAISARCDADCSITTGGAAGFTTTRLVANTVGTIIAPATKKAQKKGKGVVALTATDETGGTASTSVNAKTLRKKRARK